MPILVGALLDGPDPATTSATSASSGTRGPARGESYVKRHPVPFAEYIPLRSLARLVSDEVDLVPRDFVRRRPARRPRPVGPATVGDVICFEVAYDGIVRDIVDGGAELIVVQTNNATFGRSDETWQQLAMVRLRAVEHGRPALMAATSGVSAVVDPDGHRPAPARTSFTADVLVRAVSGREGDTLADRVGAGPELGRGRDRAGRAGAGGRRRAGRRERDRTGLVTKESG